ncbi:class I SAM-dependent methyltransferase [Rhizobium leguminosarum]|uniref:class I SAM-dependent methyltransferase n=1 Tax=Rhizobium leguminosarum TaxID=384 RepID=UPI0010326607|nr:class I SAM-dependent methyltransferase [Rhizobium leguminosarum]TAY61056.1 class I SAM-dependent methyltransferase [Rhizobium leguminosarum]
MVESSDDILKDVANYYSGRIAEHGQTAAGVDWNSQAGQIMRFNQLLKVVDSSQPYSIADIGCGYGALLDHLSQLGHATRYIGVDIALPMIEAARSRIAASPDVTFRPGNSPGEIVDYSVASGIFNVRLGRTDEEWFAYLVETLDMMNISSRTGFSFNCLTSYSDEARMRGDLFYANPLDLFDLCKRRYSRQVALLHDYELYEFTMIVRKLP